MSSILVINAAGRETRVALVENGHIAEFYLERKKDKGVVGNIYKGRVVRVLPGMQAAFVDIGLEKAAFLYVTDVFYDPEFSRSQFELTEGEHDEAPEVPEELADDHPVAAEAEHDLELEVHELAPGELAPPEPHRTITGEYAVITGEHAIVGAPEHESAAEAAHAVASDEPSTDTLVAVVAAPEGTMEGSGAGVDAAPVTEVVAPEATGGHLAAEGAGGTESPGAAVLPTVTAGTVAAPALVPEVKGERRGPKDQRPREKHRRGGREERGGRSRDDEKIKQRKTAKIEDLLKVGQEVLVQISKDPIGTKGARLTSHISIPGRHLVFMPTVDHVGISRRIGNEKERRRLRDIVDRLRPPGTGFIVRTVAENVPQEKLEADIRFLIEVWNETVRKNEKRGGAGLMHPDLDLILRATRDLFAQDVEKLVIDDRDEYERVLGFVTAQDPALKDRVILHDAEEPIFDAYGIEQEINRAVQRKVWLKSGGYLIMDQAEALTAIDVNSGRYVGKKSLEETITKINVEAAKEIVYQLRLRNIGGIIICDFIDMEKAQNREKVFKTLQEALGRDKAKTNVLKISELGLIEMTRKRVRESIGRILHEDCSYCDGQGFVKTATTVAYEIFRELRREAPAYKDPNMVISCNSEVAKLLQADERQELRHLMDRYNKSIQVKAQQNYHREQYDIYGRTLQGSEHKVASSAEVFENVNYGAPKRSSGESRGERPDRGGRDRGGRDRGGRGGGGERKQGGGNGGRPDGDRNGAARAEGDETHRAEGDRNGAPKGGGREGGGREGGGREGGGREGGGREGGGREGGGREGSGREGGGREGGGREGGGREGGGREGGGREGGGREGGGRGGREGGGRGGREGGAGREGARAEGGRHSGGGREGGGREGVGRDGGAPEAQRPEAGGAEQAPIGSSGGTPGGASAAGPSSAAGPDGDAGATRSDSSVSVRWDGQSDRTGSAESSATPNPSSAPKVAS